MHVSYEISDEDWNTQIWNIPLLNKLKNIYISSCYFPLMRQFIVFHTTTNWQCSRRYLHIFKKVGQSYWTQSRLFVLTSQKTINKLNLFVYTTNALIKIPQDQGLNWCMRLIVWLFLKALTAEVVKTIRDIISLNPLYRYVLLYLESVILYTCDFFFFPEFALCRLEHFNLNKIHVNLLSVIF